MTHKTVRDTMTPINKVFVLNIKDRLDAQTMDYVRTNYALLNEN
jgi:CBS domain containing-hemolysin-like protein